MKVVIAIDAFKGSLSSVEAGQAAAEGIRRVYPEAETVVRPVADGGEGTVDALIDGLGGTRQSVMVCGPLGLPVKAEYGICGKTAVMEMSAAAGITLVGENERNPLVTTTYGVGEMIADAAKKGCRDFIIGIGGSATNDGGIGMLEALGFGMLDETGSPVPRGANGLLVLKKITTDKVLPVLSECRFSIACDVVNPLCGEQGASAVYGPQKGATPEMVKEMDAWLLRYASLAKTVNVKADANAPGAGAAGGLGFAFLTFLNATLQRGVELILQKTELAAFVQSADYVVTGEGRLDGQTVMGKAPVGVASVAKCFGVPVIAVSGGVTPEAGVCNQHGIDAFFPIVRGVCTLNEAMKTDNAKHNMMDTTEQIFRLVQMARKD